MSRLTLLVAVVVCVVVALGVSGPGMPAANSDLLSDQVNDPVSGLSIGCGSGGLPIFQGFLPSRRLLAAVELRVRSGGSYPSDGLSFPVRIRRGSASGDVVGSAVAVAPAAMGVGGVAVVRATFAPPLILEPTGTYVIEGPSLPDPVLTWIGAYGNPYPSATAFSCNEAPAADLDLNFVSFMPSDGSEPDTTFTNAPAPDSITGSRTATLSFSGTDDLTYANKLSFICSLDGKDAEPCATPVTTPRLGDGRHSFSVSARDESGRTDATPATVRWTVDTAPPTAVTVTGPRQTHLARPTYRFAARDSGTEAAVVGYSCSIDSARLATCARSFSPRLRIGVHLLRVAARDAAGNRGPVVSVHIRRLA